MLEAGPAPEVTQVDSPPRPTFPTVPDGVWRIITDSVGTAATSSNGILLSECTTVMMAHEVKPGMVVLTSTDPQFQEHDGRWDFYELGSQLRHIQFLSILSQPTLANPAYGVEWIAGLHSDPQPKAGHFALVTPAGVPITLRLPAARFLLVVPMEDHTNRLGDLIRRKMEEWMKTRPAATTAMGAAIAGFTRSTRVRDRSPDPSERAGSGSQGKRDGYDRNHRVLMDWSITNTDGRVLAFANKEAYTERMAASRAMVRAMSNAKQARLIRDGSLLIHQLWDRVVRASRDFATAGRDAAFPHMGQLQELVGIPALQSPHRLSRVLHFGGWVGYSGVSLRWFTQQCEEAYTVWGPEVSLDGKRMVWYAIQRVETTLAVFLDESFIGTLSGWAEITRGEFSKNSDGAIRALFEGMMQEFAADLLEQDKPRTPRGTPTSVASAEGVAALLRQHSEEALDRMWSHLSCRKGTDGTHTHPDVPFVGIYPHTSFFANTHNKLASDEFWPRRGDASEGGRAKPVMNHPSVVRLDVGRGEHVDQEDYPRSSPWATPPPATKTKRTQQDANQGFCPWRVMEVMGIKTNSGSVMTCRKAASCTMNHAVTSVTEVTQQVKGQEVANYAIADSTKDALRTALRATDPTWA